MEKMKKMSKIFNSVVVSGLKAISEYYHLQASQEECRKLAQRFELPEILSFQADVVLFRDNFVHVQGRIFAQMRRQSVVSLKDFTQDMKEDFEVLFSENPPTDSDEIVDEIQNGRIDLGEVLAEQFGLALNPFPHAPGEDTPYVYTEKEEVVDSPFKNLSEIIKK